MAPFSAAPSGVFRVLLPKCRAPERFDGDGSPATRLTLSLAKESWEVPGREEDRSRGD